MNDWDCNKEDDHDYLEDPNEQEDPMIEYEAQCKKCGCTYKLQSTDEQLEAYLDSDGWMCENGRHVELGPKRNWLEIMGQSTTLTPKPVIEPKQPNEYEVKDLPNDLKHCGFGIFKNDQGIWDYRIGPEGHRLYSCKEG